MNKEEINENFNEITMNKEEISENFNKIAIDFIYALKTICPHSIIASNVDIIETLINTKSTKSVLLDQFTLNVLKYKDQIDANDDNFFLNNSFTKETVNAKNGKHVSMVIGELKNLWSDLNRENKTRIFEYMQVLCYYSHEYLLL